MFLFKLLPISYFHNLQHISYQYLLQIDFMDIMIHKYQNLDRLDLNLYNSLQRYYLNILLCIILLNYLPIMEQDILYDIYQLLLINLNHNILIHKQQHIILLLDQHIEDMYQYNQININLSHYLKNNQQYNFLL